MKLDNLLGGMMNEFSSYRKEKLSESVLDYPRKRLDPTIWDEDGIMLPEIKKEIQDRFDKWKEKNWPDIKIKDWYVLGSITTFQYNSTSDIDTNLIVDEPIEKVNKIWKQLPNGNELKNHPLNFYITVNTRDVDKSKTLYDFNNDSWVRRPSKDQNTLPGKYSLEIARFFMDGIDGRFSELNRDREELKRLEELFKSKDSYVEEEELEEEIDRMKDEIKADIDSIRLAHYIIKAFRKEGFSDEENKFQFSINITSDNDSNKSLNNLVYKEMERFGYLKKMETMEKENG